MKHILFILFLFLTSGICEGQSVENKTGVYTTKFQPRHVTYNASDNPNECWEAVAWGIEIESKGFFSLEYQAIEKLKVRIGDEEVQVEVIYYDEPIEGSYEVGLVTKITLKGEVIYKNR